MKEATHRKDLKVKTNTAVAYWRKVAYLLHQAKAIDKLIDVNPAADIKGIKSEEVTKEILSEQDIRDLIATPIHDERLKKVFLFACFTGLRISEIEAFRFQDAKHKAGIGYFFTRIQQKTKKEVRVPIKERVYELGIIEHTTPENFNQKVFDGFKHVSNYDKLQKWVYSAGIYKKVGFHTARHSFGNILHENGVDIATIAAMMGDTMETVIRNYVRISDKVTMGAVDKLNF